jgi:ferritin
MKLNKAMQEAINEQINIELHSSYMYLAMAAYCEFTMFPGCAHWMRVQSREETGHAMRLFNFMVQRNAKIVLQAVPAPQVDFANITAVFEQSLKAEEKVSESINQLYQLALNEKAFATASELEWFLKEQVEEEHQARLVLSRFNMVKGDPAALLDLDRELMARTDE